MKFCAITLAVVGFLVPAHGQVINPSGGGSGTVTSVAFAGDGGILSSTPSGPVTATGTLTAALASAAQNSVLAGPASGGAAAPTYQTAPTFSAANLTNFPTFNQNTTGSAASAASANAVNTNTFPAAAAFTSGGVPYFSSTSAVASSALLTNHGLVVGGGAGAAPASLAVGGANFPLIGQASANPAWSSIAYPGSLTSGSLLYASSTTAIATGSLPTTNALIKGNGAGNAPSGSTVIDDGKNITSTEVFVGANKSFVTSDFTDSTSTTLTLVTGLSFTLPTSKAVNVSFHCVLLFDQATAAVSDKIGIGITGTAPTQANASAVVYPSTSTLTAGTLTALASTTATSVVAFTPSAITTVWRAELDGTVEQPSNATPGVFGVYVATTTGSDNFIVKRGSYCTLF